MMATMERCGGGGGGGGRIIGWMDGHLDFQLFIWAKGFASETQNLRNQIESVL